MRLLDGCKAYDKKHSFHPTVAQLNAGICVERQVETILSFHQSSPRRIPASSSAFHAEEGRAALPGDANFLILSFMKLIEAICYSCGKHYFVNKKTYDFAEKKHRHHYCSKECMSESFKTGESVICDNCR